MEPSTTSTFASDHIIKALCNTLMHSLWQGVLLAIAGGMIIIFTKRASSVFRYNLLIAALMLFTGGITFTFIGQLKQLPVSHTVYLGNVAISSPVTVQAASPLVWQNTKEGFTDLVMNYLNLHYSMIVLIWFLVICAKSVKLAVGLHEVFHLKQTKVFAVEKYWENRLISLAAQLRVKQTISLVESGIAKIPMVIGHLKPVILIPVGLINSLTTGEVEAILLHELAHIGRRDYLVNLLQSFMEIVFFFNPAVLWISRLIKTERENCCDDITVTQTNSKLNYINALVSCHEYQLATPAFGMALAGNKSGLVGRVKRMISNSNQTLSLMEKALLTICLVSAGLFTVAFSGKAHSKNNLPKTHAAAFFHPKNDTLRGLHTTIYRSKDLGEGTTLKMIENKNGKARVSYVFKRKGVLYQINMDHYRVSSLLINEKTIPADQLNKYQSKIERLMDEYKQAEKEPLDTKTVDARALLDKLIKERAKGEVRQDDNNNTVSDLLAQIRQQNKEAAAGDTTRSDSRAVTDLLAKIRKMNNQAALADTSRANQILNNLIKQSEHRGSGSGYGYGDEKDSATLKALQRLNTARLLKLNFTPSSFLIKSNPINNEVADELMNENIIKDKNNFTFKLTNDELVVDGVKQPAAIHQRILEKYVKKPGDVINMTYSNHSK